MRQLLFLVYFLTIPSFMFGNNSNSGEITGQLKKWHKVTITFDGPETSERDEYNPFFHYRLNVTFIHPQTGKSYTKPGYFAADGNAANSSATQGNKWRVHFAPDETGKWIYEVHFSKAKWVAVREVSKPDTSSRFMDGAGGTFNIAPSDKKGRDFRARGRLEYTGGHYLEFAETNEPFLKVGADAPENFLAYEDFDGTFHDDGHKDDLVKDWQPHVKDWNEGDPTWKNGKGKGIIGALNYLASEGLNSVSFLTMNIQGDDQNVFPFINYTTYNRYDVSKLAQWEQVFAHADSLGIFLHFKTQEVENQGLLDNGGLGADRKLYYRELIARFGHHLALNWNLGEENGENDWLNNPPTAPQNTMQRRAMAHYFHEQDPYSRHIVVHNGEPVLTQETMFKELYGTSSKLTGPSIQTHQKDFGELHETVLQVRKKSAESGKLWAVAVDEPGDHRHGVMPDEDNTEHNLARKNGLWGAFMAGAWGTEWYFGYKHEHSDMTAQDYRSRDIFWDQCRYALKFFEENNIPVRLMQPHDELTGKEDDYVLARPGFVYVVYQKTGADFTIDLSGHEGDFGVQWYNPRSGKYVQDYEVEGGENQSFEFPDPAQKEDWVVLIRKVEK